MLRNLEKLSRTDTLTELPNRKHINEELNRRWNSWKSRGLPLTVIMFDIDHFKLVNDHLGHDYGDFALKRVAHALRNTLHNTDIAGCLGGDEFIIIFPADGAKDKVAINLAERVRSRIE